MLVRITIPHGSALPLAVTMITHPHAGTGRALADASVLDYEGGDDAYAEVPDPFAGIPVGFDPVVEEPLAAEPSELLAPAPGPPDAIVESPAPALMPTGAIVEAPAPAPDAGAAFAGPGPPADGPVDVLGDGEAPKPPIDTSTPPGSLVGAGGTPSPSSPPETSPDGATSLAVGGLAAGIAAMLLALA